MKKLMLLASLVLLYSCDSDDIIPYDPVAQLQTDISLIDAFLLENGQAVEIHSSGIRYTIDNPGQGDFPVAGDSVATHYDIYTLEGQLIDTTNEDTARENGIFSSSRTYDLFVFELGVGSVIEGYEIGTKLLNLNAEGNFYVPSTLAYRNSPGFGLNPNQILRMRIEVVDIF